MLSNAYSETGNYPQPGTSAEIRALITQNADFLKETVRLRMDGELRPRVDPSDIVQDAQMEALRRADDYLRNPQLPLRLWLRQIALDRLVMARRRHLGAQRRTLHREWVLPAESSLGLAARLTGRTPSPSDAAGQAETIEIIRQAISRLAAMDREIILLLAMEGLNSTEAAKLLNIRADAARQRYGRALRRLRVHLPSVGLEGMES
ncbi:RNA polymerase sigma factor CnrH [Maioricimonas rarisocia]|uniref:RNA polymerase sigma factor CnrH n=1 Tax=Maioricimonas rarisocia TaxID=2528026 RepID=A0A517Z3Y6_9PLAN|nr:sigma-70 family RNA polymerase sigma factor [Maioricimonas rarisocia]QDU37166.1 RNA polymerase sigma factor CnrH [Maioricimonas rarisocia]